jgi:hypothetical protein
MRNSSVSLSQSFTVDPGKISFANSHSNATENNKVLQKKTLVDDI